MKKWCIESFLFLSAMNIQAMEIQKINTTNHLFLLPIEILNKIAEFLWESEEDFFKRAQAQAKEIKVIPPEYYNFLNFREDDNILGVFSADKSKILLFELFSEACLNPGHCYVCPDPKLVIIDTEKKKKKDRILYSGCLENTCYRAIAISSGGKVIAVIRKQKVVENADSININESYKDFLVIKKLNEKKEIIKNKEYIFDIPKYFIPNNLLFNKQNTSLIMYGNDFTNSFEGKEKYILFGKQHNNSHYSLYDYFECRAVCKNKHKNKYIKNDNTVD